MLSRNSTSASNIIFICYILLPLDSDGFVAHVFSIKSKAGSEFFEVKFKIAEATCVTIRIMKQGKSKYYWKLFTKIKLFTKKIIYDDLIQEREPLTFKKLSKTPKGD